MADVIKDCLVYNDKETRFSISEFKAGITVEILEDYSETNYFVRDNLTGIKGWVCASSLLLPPDKPTDKSQISKHEIEGYINIKGISSDTNHLIFTDINRQITHILTGKQYNWKLERSFSCASGKNSSPTTRGIYKICDRGEWFYSERLESGGKYWMRFNGNYLFHSVSMNKNMEIIDGRIGERISNGCIRLEVENIKWIYENVPDGSTVYIV